jgi:hypothetical protein
MKIKPTYSLALMAVMGSMLVAKADYLPNNFWPNPGFELGTNLNQTNGVPTGWIANGDDPTICQVTTNNSVSPTHALAVIDNEFFYGEWDSAYLNLTGHANPGDTINAQWYQMYSVQAGGEMRVAVLFFDVNTNLVTANQYVVNGDSPGWGGSIASSTFTKVDQTILVPLGATQMQISLVSGGSEATAGTMVIDDLSVAEQATPQLLSGNFWPNPSFELGSNLNNPTNAVPTGWNFFNSGSPIICQVTTNNYVSASHALALIDNDSVNYGSWYSNPVPLPGNIVPGSILNAQWFELYSIANGNMRVTFSWFNAANNDIQDVSFQVTGNSPGWQGAVAGSGFTKVNQQLTVPANAVALQVQVVSAGSGAETGILLIDDLSIALPPPSATLLPGNFWPNPGFESGSNLNQTNGVPTGWNFFNSGSSYITQVTTNNYVSPTHALAVVDNDPLSYGSWYSDHAPLTNTAIAGSILDLQWYELYSITNGDMRVVFTFFDGSGNGLGDNNFPVNGNSAGWQGAVAGSGFTQVNTELTVPAGAVTIAVQLVSAGSGAETGVMLIDDLSVAVHVVQPLPPTVLAGNFFPNPTFEAGVQLDNPTLGIPAGGWNRGGSSAAIDQVLTNNSTSPTHSLALVDNDTGNYGEWYMFLNTAGLVGDNDAVDIQWYQMYNVTNGSMRLSFAFLDSGNNTLWSQDFTTGTSTNSPGWTGNISTSPFQQISQRFAVPVGTTQLRVNFASGGATTVTGVMLIDDLSMRLSLPAITGFTSQAGSNTVTWNSMSSKQYAVLFSGTLGSGAAWSAVATNLPGTGLSTSNLDTTVHPGGKGFYRVEQE